MSSDIGKEHPAYLDGVHPSNRIAAIEIARSIISQEGKVRSFENYMIPNRNSELILIGGPISTLTTREAMGYNKEDIEKEPQTDLRFIFYLNKKELEPVKMMVKGETLTEPNYYILDRDTSKKYIPRAPEEWLVDDFLLINVMPNNLTKRKGKFIVNFAGCHGIGTEASALVLKNKQILEEIKKKRGKEGRAFQSIIHITAVKQETNHFKPLKIEHVKTVPIETEIY